MDEKEVHKALQTIVDNAGSKALNWAVNYARVGLRMSGDDLRTQCLYVLCNIEHWRGPEAKEVRDTLKAFCKIKR